MLSKKYYDSGTAFFKCWILKMQFCWCSIIKTPCSYHVKMHYCGIINNYYYYNVQMSQHFKNIKLLNGDVDNCSFFKCPAAVTMNQRRIVTIQFVKQLNRSKCHLVKVSYCQTVMLPTTASLKCHNLSMPGAYSQHLIFFVTYEWTQQARVSYYIRMEGLAMDKHSNLGSFTSYEETEVL